jgi:small GTP-binding protein
MDSNEIYNFIFKIILIGDCDTGKTSLINRYVKRMFNEKYVCTIGVDFMMKSALIEENLIKLQIWDTAGMERYKHITLSYYRGAHAAIICFDLTNRLSFESLNRWMKEYSNYHKDSNTFVIVGNKSDLAEREVNKEEILKFVEIHNSIYFETSAKNGNNIDELFNHMAQLLYDKNKNNIVEIPKRLKSISDYDDLTKSKKKCVC